jgi:tetratricopeptide (TPR) repeat protein
VKPKGPKALVAQAERLRDRGELEKALDLYDRALEQDPEHVGALAGRGLCYLDLESYEEAIRSFQEALRQDPENADALLGAAEAYRSTGKAAEAIRHYERYLLVHPDGDEAPVARTALEQLRR